MPRVEHQDLPAWRVLGLPCRITLSQHYLGIDFSASNSMNSFLILQVFPTLLIMLLDVLDRRRRHRDDRY